MLSGDAEDFLVFANDAAVVSFGAGFESLRGRGWLDRIRAEDRAEVGAALALARSSRRTARATFVTADSADPTWLQMLVVPLARYGNYVGWVATLDDVTAERELAHRATHDALTGLPNRWLVMDRLQQALAKCARHHDGVAVVFIDIDELKAHNDAVRSCRRRCDPGSTSLVSSPPACDRATPLDGSAVTSSWSCPTFTTTPSRADRSRSLLARYVPHGRLQLSVSASVGVAFTDDPAMSPAELLAEADADMYRHKSRR